MVLIVFGCCERIRATVNYTICIRNINDRFNTMQVKFSKAVGQDGGHRFRHDALPPKGAMKFITGRGSTKIGAELMETARADDSLCVFERDAVI